SGTAYALNGTGGSSPVGAVSADATANVFGIRLLGGAFSGNLTNGSGTSSAAMSQTLLSDFNANISNTNAINANAVSHATAFSSDGSTAIANVTADAAGINVEGVFVNANVLATGLGNVTNTYSGTYVGNISNSGAIHVGTTGVGIAGT